MHTSTLFRTLLAMLFAFAFGPALFSQAVDQEESDTSDNDQEVITLPEFEVKGDAIGNQYLASEAVSATRMGVKIVDTPFAVQTITETMINDFQMFEDDEMFEAVGGSVTPGVGVRVRGFVIRKQVEGLNAIYAMPLPSIMLRQMEIVKGAQSTSYGDSAPGGISNRVAKKPTTRSASEGRAIWGTDDYYDAYLMDSGPLAKSFSGNKLFYRVYAQYTRADGIIDFNKSEKYYLGGTLMYLPRKGTSLAITPAFQHDRARAAHSSPMTNRLTRRGLVGSDPWITSWKGIGTISFQHPDALYEVKYKGLSATMEHRVSSNISAKVYAAYISRNLTHEGWSGGANYLYNATFGEYRTDKRTPMVHILDRYAYVGRGDVTWNTRTGSVKHRMLAAADFVYRWDEDSRLQIPEPYASMYPDEVRFFSLDKPEYARVDTRLATDKILYKERSEYNLGGLFYLMSDFMNGRLKTTASARYQYYDTEIDAWGASKELLQASESKGKFSYVLGLNYHIIGSALVFYMGGGTGCDLSAMEVDDGILAISKPAESRSLEFGFKGEGLEILGTKMFYTLSFFDARQFDKINNDAEYDSSMMGNMVIPQYARGKINARGIELDTTWIFSKAFTLKLGGSYVDSDVERAAAGSPWLWGRAATSVAPWTGFLIMDYRFQNRALKGLRLGVKGVYQGKRDFSFTYVDSTGRVREGLRLKADFLLDAHITYGFRVRKVGHEFKFNVRNATDRETFDNNGRPRFGREFRLTYLLKF